MKKITLGLILLLLNQFVSAQFTNDTTANYIVRDSLSTEQLTPLSATTSTGQTYISWFDSYNSNYQLRMQLLDEFGNKLWPDSGLVVSSLPQNSALYRYDLKVDNEDNAIVAFQDERSGSLKVVAYKIGPSANFIWGATGVELTDSSAQGLAPTIGVTMANNAVIAWHADLGSSKWVSFQKISSTGTVLWSKRIFDNTNTNKYSRAVLTSSGIDDIIMMYVEELGNFPGVTSTLYSQIFDSNGDPVWSVPLQVSTKTIPYFVFPQIISDLNDGFFTAFNTSNPINPGLNDVYAQHVQANGTLWSATGTQVANSSTEHKSTGGFCYNLLNDAFYINLQVLDGGQGSSGVFIQGIDASGSVLMGANGIQLKNVDPIYYNPHALVDAGNGLISIFSFGSFGAQQIASIKTDYNGSLLWGFEPAICNYNSNKDDLSAGLFKNNQTVIVWEDDRLDAGVYLQNLNGDGSFGIITSITEVNRENELFLYPNPSSFPILKLNSKTDDQASIIISSIEGEECLRRNYPIQSGINEIRIDNMPFAAGIYLITISTNTATSYTKWIKE